MQSLPFAAQSAAWGTLSRPFGEPSALKGRRADGADVSAADGLERASRRGCQYFLVQCTESHT